MKASPPILIAVVLAAFAAGRWLGPSPNAGEDRKIRPARVVSATDTGKVLPGGIFTSKDKSGASVSVSAQRAKSLQWAAQASVVEVEQTLRGIRRVPPSQRDALRSACVRRLCALDPQEALHFATTAFAERDEANALTSLAVGELVRLNPDQAGDVLAKIPWNLREQSTGVALAALMESPTPERIALAMAVSEKLPYNKSSWLRELAKTNLELAKTVVDQTKGSTYERNQALGSMIEGLVDVDPAAALKMMEEHVMDLNFYAYEPLRALGRKNPEAVLALLAKAPKDRGYGYSSALKAWAEKDPLAALEKLQSQPELKSAHAATASTAILALAKTDLAAADAAFRALPEGLRDKENPAVTGLGREYAKKDPLAALAWVATLPQADQDLARNGVMTEFLTKDPAAALRLWQADPKSIPSLSAVGNQFSQALLTLEPKARQGILSGISAEDRISLIPSSSYSFDPASVPLVCEIIGSLPPKTGNKQSSDEDNSGNPAIPSFAANWAKADPIAAAVWSDTLKPETPDRLLVDANIISNWAKHDSAATSQWVAGISDPARRDSATRYLAEELLSQGRKQDAASLAAGITDATVRKKLEDRLKN